MAVAAVEVQRCSPFTETGQTIRDGELRTATSTFTQLLSSVAVVLSNILISFIGRPSSDTRPSLV